MARHHAALAVTARSWGHCKSSSPCCEQFGPGPTSWSLSQPQLLYKPPLEVNLETPEQLPAACSSSKKTSGRSSTAQSLVWMGLVQLLEPR